MKIKTSITLDERTLAALDELATEPRQRSQLVECAVVEYVARRQRQARDRRDAAILDELADELNEDLAEALADQAEF